MERVPQPGDIVHASEVWEEPGGGGAVAAVQLAKLARGATFFTALGDDALGHRAHDALVELGLRVEAVFRPEPQRRGFVHVDAQGERTITVIGDRLGPCADDPLPWHELVEADAVYLTAVDAGAVNAARKARMLVSTARGLEILAEAGVRLDALVASGADSGEHYERGPLGPEPDAVVRTAGDRGRHVGAARGRAGRLAGRAPARARERRLRVRRQLRRRASPTGWAPASTCWARSSWRRAAARRASRAAAPTRGSTPARGSPRAQ